MIFLLFNRSAHSAGPGCFPDRSVIGIVLHCCPNNEQCVATRTCAHSLTDVLYLKLNPIWIPKGQPLGAPAAAKWCHGTTKMEPKWDPGGSLGTDFGIKTHMYLISRDNLKNGFPNKVKYMRHLELSGTHLDAIGQLLGAPAAAKWSH